MATVRVVLRKSRKLKDGRYPIVIRLTHNKKVKYIFTGYSALEKEWNGKYPYYLNNKHPSHKELNQYLFRKYSEVSNQLLKYEQAGKPYTVYDLHSIAVDKPSPTTLFNFAESLIEKLIKSGRIGNAESYKTAVNAVKRFTKGKDLHFQDISHKCFLILIHNYCNSVTSKYLTLHVLDTTPDYIRLLYPSYYEVNFEGEPSPAHARSHNITVFASNLLGEYFELKHREDYTIEVTSFENFELNGTTIKEEITTCYENYLAQT